MDFSSEVEYILLRSVNFMETQISNFANVERNTSETSDAERQLTQNLTKLQENVLCVKECCMTQSSILEKTEGLPEQPLKLGYKNAKQADLCLVLGSSLTVTPAADLPEIVGTQAGNVSDSKLCIVNLQKTPLDDVSCLRVFSKCDEFIELVMKELKLEIPPFILTRRLKIKKTEKKETQLLFEGVDAEGHPFSFIKAMEIGDQKNVQVQETAPFFVKVKKEQKYSVVIHFMGHYNEPPLTLFKDQNLSSLLDQKETIFLLNYNPNTGKWIVKENTENESSNSNSNNNNNSPKENID